LSSNADHPLRDKHPAPAPAHGALAILDARIYGKAEDLTVLDSDPMDDPKGFSSVRYVIRNGTVIVRRPTTERAAEKMRTLGESTH
jgi:hypothetical protein